MNYALLRTNMIQQQVRPWYVLDDTVLEVMAKIAREKFVPTEFAKLAYSDTDIPLPENQTMLSPKVVGKALQALKILPENKVLEIGTGTGYVTACLAELAKEVISLEINETLFSLAKQNINSPKVTLIKGDGVYGFGNCAPYDAIFITGSYPLGIPEKVCEQLNPQGGKLFAFYGQAPAMEAVLITRHGPNHYSTEALFETVVPALIGAPAPSRFQF